MRETERKIDLPFTIVMKKENNKEKNLNIFGKREDSTRIVISPYGFTPYLLHFYRMQFSQLANIVHKETHCLLVFTDWLVCRILIDFLKQKNTQRARKRNRQTNQEKDKRWKSSLSDHSVHLSESQEIEPYQHELNNNQCFSMKEVILNEKYFSRYDSNTSFFDNLPPNIKVSFQQLPANNSIVYNLLSKSFTIFYTTRPDVIETMERRNRSRYNGREILFGALSEQFTRKTYEKQGPCHKEDIIEKGKGDCTDKLTGKKLKKNIISKTEENDSRRKISKKAKENESEKCINGVETSISDRAKKTIDNHFTENINEKVISDSKNDRKISLFSYYSTNFYKKYDLNCEYFNVFKNIHLAVLMAAISLAKESQINKKYNQRENVSKQSYSQMKDSILGILIRLPELLRANKSFLKSCIDDLKMLLVCDDWHSFAIKEVENRNVQWIWRIIK